MAYSGPPPPPPLAAGGGTGPPASLAGTAPCAGGGVGVGAGGDLYTPHGVPADMYHAPPLDPPPPSGTGIPGVLEMAYELDRVRRKLVGFYARHCPNKVQFVDRILRERGGVYGSENVFAELRVKYAGGERYLFLYDTVEAFYRMHALHHKAERVADVLDEWEGREIRLFRTLEKKHGSTYFTDRGLLPLKAGSIVGGGELPTPAFVNHPTTAIPGGHGVGNPNAGTSPQPFEHGLAHLASTVYAPSPGAAPGAQQEQQQQQLPPDPLPQLLGDRAASMALLAASAEAYVRDVYTRDCPQLLPFVPMLLATYKDNLDVLCASVEAKFNAPLPTDVRSAMIALAAAPAVASPLEDAVARGMGIHANVNAGAMTPGGMGTSCFDLSPRHATGSALDLYRSVRDTMLAGKARVPAKGDPSGVPRAPCPTAGELASLKDLLQSQARYVRSGEPRVCGGAAGGGVSTSPARVGGGESATAVEREPDERGELIAAQMDLINDFAVRLKANEREAAAQAEENKEVVEYLRGLHGRTARVLHEVREVMTADADAGPRVAVPELDELADVLGIDLQTVLAAAGGGGVAGEGAGAGPAMNVVDTTGGAHANEPSSTLFNMTTPQPVWEAGAVTGGGGSDFATGIPSPSPQQTPGPAGSAPPPYSLHARPSVAPGDYASRSPALLSQASLDSLPASPGQRRRPRLGQPTAP